MYQGQNVTSKPMRVSRLITKFIIILIHPRGNPYIVVKTKQMNSVERY